MPKAGGEVPCVARGPGSEVPFKIGWGEGTPPIMPESQQPPPRGGLLQRVAGAPPSVGLYVL
jgi:hypothetical protein